MYKQAVLTIGCTSPACGGVYRGYRTYPPYYSGSGSGVGRLHRGPPGLWRQRRQCQRSNLADGVWWRCGYRFCGGCEGEVIQGHAKTPPQGKIKRFSCPYLTSWGSREGVGTSMSENKTRLVADGPPWRWDAGLAASQALGGWPWQCGTPGLAPLYVQGLRRLVETISYRCLTQMVKEHSPQCSTSKGHCRATGSFQIKSAAPRK